MWSVRPSFSFRSQKDGLIGEIGPGLLQHNIVCKRFDAVVPRPRAVIIEGIGLMMDGVVAVVTNFFYITFRKKACMGEVIVFECQRRGLLATYCTTNTIERIAPAIWFSVRLPSRRRKQSLLHSQLFFENGANAATGLMSFSFSPS
uniref:Uncharacterized protein n=1 Tax=Haemonchus contortus TaxID=6289 RepID=A0A7I4YVM7_HAECO